MAAERKLPHSLEAEMSLLGSMILDYQVIGDVTAIIRGPGDFYKPAHGALYAAIVALYDRAGQLDNVLLIEKLRDNGMIEKVGGLDYVVSLAENVPVAMHATHYAKIVAESAAKRGILAACEETAIAVYEQPHLSPREIMDGLDASVLAQGQTDSASATVEAGAILQEEFNRLERGEVEKGIKTGLHVIDDLTLGFHAGDFVIIAARPSMGKTALALGIADSMAYTDGLPVAFFSGEMNTRSLAWRLISLHSGVDHQVIRRGNFTSDDIAALADASKKMSKLPLYIDDTGGLSVTQIRLRARNMVKRYGVAAVFVDYVQILSQDTTRGESENVRVGDISRGLKNLSRELNLPVVALSQCNRESAKRADNRIKLSDLRASGSLEQDADVVLLLHRPAYYASKEPDFDDWCAANPDLVNAAEIDVAKQRNGPTGIVTVNFHGPTMEFRNRAEHC